MSDINSKSPVLFKKLLGQIDKDKHKPLIYLNGLKNNQCMYLAQFHTSQTACHQNEGFEQLAI